MKELENINTFDSIKHIDELETKKKIKLILKMMLIKLHFEVGNKTRKTIQELGELCLKTLKHQKKV